MAKQAKAKMGRPSKYTEDACRIVVELGREGASRAEMAADLDISFATWQNWEAAHPEFLAATIRARELGQSWWEKQGRKGIWSKEFNANAYRLQVTNRFPADWRDKQDHEVSGPGGGPVEMIVTRKVVPASNRIAQFTSGNGANGSH